VLAPCHVCDGWLIRANRLYQHFQDIPLYGRCALLLNQIARAVHVSRLKLLIFIIIIIISFHVFGFLLLAATVMRN
jgi:hypothetical protein